MNLNYGKAILTAIVSAIGAAVTVLGPGNMNLGDLGTNDWLRIILAVLGSAGLVWFAENGPWHTYIKTVLGAATAFVTSLLAAYSDGVVTQGELLVAISAAVVATGLVFQVSDPAENRNKS